MSVNHPRTGISHDFPDPAAHILPVTMDRAIRAGGLAFRIGTLPDFSLYVFQQFIAVPARLPVMKLPAEHVDHDTGGLYLQIFPAVHLSFRLLVGSAATAAEPDQWKNQGSTIP